MVPQGRLRWLAAMFYRLYASLCLLLGGIPRNSACNGTPFLLRSHTRDQQKNNKRGKKASSVMPLRPAGGVALPFLCLFPCSCLLPVRTPASQGPTSPSSAPPRCQNNLATLPHHTHTRRGGEFTRDPAARPARDLCFLAGDNEHRPVSTTGVAPRGQ